MLNDWTVLFDAVGTLIEPVPDAATTYFQFARQHGSQIPEATIREKFGEARKLVFNSGFAAQECKIGQFNSSDAIERELWRNLVAYVVEDIRPIEPVFETLWEHFADPRSWRLYPDVAPCFNQLQVLGVRISIASNFDSRIRAIARLLAPLAICEPVFCSAEIGFRKPDPSFYREIQRRGRLDSARTLMVGDDRENDFLGPKNIGWNAIWLQRGGGTSGETISSLTEVSGQLKILAAQV